MNHSLFLSKIGEYGKTLLKYGKIVGAEEGLREFIMSHVKHHVKEYEKKKLGEATNKGAWWLNDRTGIDKKIHNANMKYTHEKANEQYREHHDERCVLYHTYKNSNDPDKYEKSPQFFICNEE